MGGFGFISCMESRRVYRKDVFLHKAQIGQESDLYRQRTKVDISRGDMIKFTVEIQRGQPRAKDVEIVGHSERILAPDTFGTNPAAGSLGSTGAAAGSSESGQPEKKRRHDDDRSDRRQDREDGGAGRRDERS